MFCYGAPFNKECSQGLTDQSCTNNGSCQYGRCESYTCKDLIPLDDCTRTCNEPSDCESGKCPVVLTGNFKRSCDGADGLKADGCFCATNKACRSGRCEEVDGEMKCYAQLGVDEYCEENTGMSSTVYNYC